MLVVCTFDILKKPLKNPDVLNSIKGNRREEFWEMITSRKMLCTSRRADSSNSGVG